MPERLQRRRVKGWRMPVDAVYVGRPSKWGNPYRGADAFDLFDQELRGCVADPYGAAYPIQIRIIAESIHELAGKDLVCWCPHDRACHADTLIELARQGTTGGEIDG